tara:strand:+ start:543 stop:2651 length:2109 start_codon:yes stop_codon:yes gene_type:complete
MPPVKSLGNSRAQYNYKFGLTGFEAALPPPGPVYSDDVFSTYLYEGTGSAQKITNGINLSGEGGLVWLKGRESLSAPYTNLELHCLFDNVRTGATGGSAGGGGRLRTDSDQIQQPDTYLDSYNSDGFTLTSTSSVNEASIVNENGKDFVSWSFRKQPGFFDIVTYEGDGNNGKTIPHSLGSTPGFVMIKRLDVQGSRWICWHRSTGTAHLVLSASEYAGESYNNYFTVDASNITINSSNATTNIDGSNYIAYIFAHDDQRFGTNEDESIIKCGSYNGISSGGIQVNLGFEPQWVMIKRSSGTATSWTNWVIFDNMRGVLVDGAESPLAANLGAEENSTNLYGSDNLIEFNPTGIKIDPTGQEFTSVNTNGETFVYIAIRRPHKPITDPTKLFAVGGNTSSEPEYVSNFVVDMAFHRNLGTNLTDDTAIFSRLTGSKALVTNSTASETTSTIDQFDFMDGWGDNQANDSNYKSWMFRRAPGFFDVVAYDGDSDAARQIPHNLEVKPEMIIIKNRSYTSGSNWTVWHKDIYDTTMVLNGNDGWVNGGPSSTYGGGGVGSTTGTALLSSTSTYFKPASGFLENSTGETYISYHFASLPGVSKIGTYTGTGGAFNVDCGFSSSARFVLIKRADEIAPGNAGNWRVYDTSQGIVDGGNDPYFELNTQDAQITNNDGIDSYQNGFALTGSGNFEINADGGTYIYLAIA